MVARGVMLGPEQPVILHLLDIPPAAQALEGVRMEIVDAAFPLVKGTLLFFTHHTGACSSFKGRFAVTYFVTANALWQSFGLR